MTTLMPHLFALAYKAAPGIRFELRPQIAYPHRLLERGEADLLIIPKEYCSTEHPAEVLLEETYCCVMWSDSPLAQGEMTNERYMAAGHVVVQVGDAQAAIEDWFMQRLGVCEAGRGEHVQLRVAGAPAGRHEPDRHHAPAARRRSRAQPADRAARGTGAGPTMEQAMQWHKHRTSDPGLTWLRGLLKEAVAKMDEGRHDAR
ncbi:hypothetical protein K8B66_28625 [Burkholderia contaminans]|nr:LysR substrate-binding domain-containing protein [Burkholderia contaminans]UAC73159.1 hypothetical protein K8B66_28625 [Burkholderia contaminans]